MCMQRIEFCVKTKAGIPPDSQKQRKRSQGFLTTRKASHGAARFPRNDATIIDATAKWFAGVGNC